MGPARVLRVDFFNHSTTLPLIWDDDFSGSDRLQMSRPRRTCGAALHGLACLWLGIAEQDR
jgi:hypothetical protein